MTMGMTKRTPNTSQSDASKAKPPGRGRKRTSGDAISASQQLLFAELSDAEQALAPLQIIRTETVLSKLPIHCLSSARGQIAITEKNEQGAVVLRWEVSYNQKFGPPGQMAYKLDTLIINKAIDEAGRPLPKVIRLGSLREVAQRMGLGTQTAKAKMALRQNAGAWISCLMTYRAADGAERTVEADFNRYSLVFAGEQLPDGAVADAVHLVLNDVYHGILKNAPYRPVDWDYMYLLPPMSQRFYELASYRVFAALKHGRHRASITYSEFCTGSNQVRYFELTKVQKQMYKVLRPHKAEGYITGYTYEECADKQGQADWVIHLTPGPRATAEFKTYNSKPRGKKQAAGKGTAELGPSDPDVRARLVRGIAERGVRPKAAEELVAALDDASAAEAEDKMEYYDYLLSTPHFRKNTANPPGLLVKMLRDSEYAIPPTFVTNRAKAAWESAERERSARKRRAPARDELDAVIEALPRRELEALRVEALRECYREPGYPMMSDEEKGELLEERFRAVVRERVREAS